MKQYFKMAIIATALSSVVGCQSTNNTETSVAVEKNRAVSSVLTFDVLQKQYTLDKATFDSVEEFRLYSEPTYNIMTESWNDAKEIYLEVEKEPGLINEEYSMFSSGSYATKYSEYITKADAELSKLKRYKEQADVVLSDAISQMDYMTSIDVNTYYPAEFASLNSQYKTLFITVIEDDIAEAQTEQASFLTNAKAIEIDTTLKIYVYPLEKEFNQLSQKGFKTIAPISYGQAKAELDKTQKAVQANNRDEALISSAVNRTVFQLDHLKNMAAEVKLLQAVKNGQFEQPVLEFENKLLSISQAINGNDYRDQPLRTQTTSILDSVQQMHEANNTVVLEKKIQELSAQIKSQALTIENQTEDRSGVQKQVLVLTQQLERNDNLINNLNDVIASFKEKEQATEKVAEEKVELPVVESEKTAIIADEVKAKSTEEVAVVPVVTKPKTQEAAVKAAVAVKAVNEETTNEGVIVSE